MTFGELKNGTIFGIYGSSGEEEIYVKTNIPGIAAVIGDKNRATEGFLPQKRVDFLCQKDCQILNFPKK